MAYDRELADRIRFLTGGEPALSEKAMFGGLAFLIAGHMGLAASRDGGLLVRVDPDAGDALIAAGQAEPMVMRGREMPGWLRVPADAVAEDDALAEWIGRGLGFVRALPPR